jgi:acetolactate synthase-1/2/3 large subunit
VHVAAAETGTAKDLPRIGGRAGSDFMVDVIKTLEIKYLPANPASSFRGLHESLINYGRNTMPEFLTCAHEESAVAMGHGYFKVAGKPLMTLCHGSVGMQHASMAIYNAWCDRVPVIVVGGNDLDAAHRPPGVPTIHSAQDINALVRDYTKWDDTPFSLQHFAQSFVRAYKIATTPPYGPVAISLDAGLQQEPIVGNGEKLYIPRYVPTSPPQGDSGAVKEAARLLANAQNPVIVVDRAARSENGMRLIVQLAEALQAAVVDQGGRMNFPSTHYLKRPPSVINNADVILGMELTDYWGTVNTHIDNGEHGIGTNSPKVKPDTKLISISSVDLNTKANYQDFQRFQVIDVQMAADAEATLPGLIEEVKEAIPNRKTTIEKRGEAANKAFAEARNRIRQNAALAWDASPISTARMAMEIWAEIKDLDWSLVSSSGIGNNWPNVLWRMEKYQQWLGASGGYGVGYGAPAAVGAALANRDLGRFSVNIQADGDLMYAPGVLWTAARHNIPLAHGHAQQSRLSPGGHAPAEALELPQSRRQSRQGLGSHRHQHPESRHRVSQARGVHGLVGEGSHQGSGRARAGHQAGGRRGKIRPARAAQRLDAAAVGAKWDALHEDHRPGGGACRRAHARAGRAGGEGQSRLCPARLLAVPRLSGPRRFDRVQACAGPHTP